MKKVLSEKSLRAVYGLAALMLASVVLLWSWNILSSLFGGPVAQYKHAVAALAVAWVLGWMMRIAGRQRHRPRFQPSDRGRESLQKQA